MNSKLSPVQVTVLAHHVRANTQRVINELLDRREYHTASLVNAKYESDVLTHQRAIKKIDQEIKVRKDVMEGTLIIIRGQQEQV